MDIGNDLANAYDEGYSDGINKNKFYEMWRKSDEIAERYGGLLIAIYEFIHTKKEDDVDCYDVIRQIIDDWYESEIIKKRRKL